MEVDDGGQSLNIATIVDLQPLVIHYPAVLRVSRRGVHRLNYSIRLHIFDCEWARQLGLKLYKEKLELEVFLHKFPIMISFHFLLVNLGGLIGIEPYFFQLQQLQLLLFP